MIDPVHLLTYVIRPVITSIGLHSWNAEKLILGTGCQESECGRWLHQRGTGPALGIFQMEPATHNDHWHNFLLKRPQLAKAVAMHSCVPLGGVPSPRELIANLAYATAMCRIHYLRVPEAIPADLPGQAAYWKKYYNTELGAGKVEDYINNWRRFVPANIV